MPTVQDILDEMNEIEPPESFESDPESYKSNNDRSTDNAILRDCVRSVLTSYINDLDGHSVDDLYQLVLAEVEAPLLETILGHTNGNQSKAAQMLGINRGTLRKKLKQYNIND